jgi:chaperone modulatory protein CbpM
MIMDAGEFVVQARIDTEILDEWVEAGWLLPRQNGAGRHFSEVDLARAQLIRDLHTLGVNDESVPIILDLVDQLHGLRHMMRELLSAIRAEQMARDRA